MVYLLLDAAPGSAVSLEVLEDVAVEDPTGEVDATQIKSALKTNPVSNRAVDFWKTFSNWMTAAEAGELDATRTNFEIRLGRKRSGSICDSFANAKLASEAKGAIAAAKKEFYTEKSGKLRKGLDGDLRGFIEEVFAPTRTSLFEMIVRHFAISAGSGHAYEDLVAKIRTKVFDEDLTEDVLLHGLAWTKKCVDTAIENDLPPVISVNAFRKELVAFRDRLRGRDYLPSFASRPSPVQIELERIRVFVRQLEFVDFAEDQVLRAISDFLISKADRVQYAERFYVHQDSFKEFEDALVALWMNHRDEIEIDQQKTVRVRGKMLALRCLREMLKLQGVEVNATFVRGCFHTLADVKTIGWHPDYVSLLEQGDDQ